MQKKSGILGGSHKQLVEGCKSFKILAYLAFASDESFQPENDEPLAN